MLKYLLLPPVDAAAGIDLRRAARAGTLIMALLVVGGGTWLALAPLSGAVIAPGFVRLDLNRKVVQHQEGGIVKQVLVRDGDQVRAGQALIVLDDVRVDAAGRAGEEAARRRARARRAPRGRARVPDGAELPARAERAPQGARASRS